MNELNQDPWWERLGIKDRPGFECLRRAARFANPQKTFQYALGGKDRIGYIEKYMRNMWAHKIIALRSR
jgi:hypothetical protein